jgi:hypothetical protein
VDVELRQQPASNEGADNADYDITNDAKTSPSHDFTSQPARNETD